MANIKLILFNLRREDFSTSSIEAAQDLLKSKVKIQCADVCDLLIYCTEAIKKHGISILMPCIRLCLDYVSANFSRDEVLKSQFLDVVYHMNEKLLKQELYPEALSVVPTLENYLFPKENLFKKKDAYKKNLYSFYWNEALNTEKKNKDSAFAICLTLRNKALKFLLSYSGPSKFDTLLQPVLSCYCKGNKSKDPKLVTDFLNDIIEHIKLSLDFPDSGGKNLHLFKVICVCSQYLMKQFNDSSLTACIHSHLSAISTSLRHCSSETILKTCIEVSTLSIQIFLLNKKKVIGKRDLSSFKQLFSSLGKKSSSSDQEAIVYACAFFYFCFPGYFKTTDIEADSNLKVIKESLDFCLLMSSQFLNNFFAKNVPEILNQSAVTAIGMACNLVCALTSIIKSEAIMSNRERFIKSTESFVTLAVKEFESFFLLSELQKYLASFVSRIGNVGIVLYHLEMYEESIYFFEVNCLLLTKCTSDIDPSEQKKTMLQMKKALITSLVYSGKHLKALQVVARLLTEFDDYQECFKLWKKIKYDATMKNNTSVASCSVVDLFEELKIDINPEKQLALLCEELKVCRTSRDNLEEEICSIIKHIFALNCSDLIRAQVYLAVLTMPVTVGAKISKSLNKSFLVLCSDAIQLFKDYVNENDSDVFVKLQLSVAYFCLYRLKAEKVHKAAEKESSLILRNPPKPVDESATDDGDDENDKCDIQPLITLLTLPVETNLIECLKNALNIWNDVSKICGGDWNTMSKFAEEWNLLNIMQAAAEYFALSAFDVEEFTTWCILQNVASGIGKKEMELYSSIAVANYLLRFGFLEEASQQLKCTESQIPCSSSDDRMIIFTRKLQLAQSELCLLSGEFDKGFELLRGILDSLSTYTSHSLLTVLALESSLLQSHFLAVPPSAYENEKNVSYFNDHRAFSNAMLCTKALFKASSGDKGIFAEILHLKPLSLRLLLTAYVHLGELSFDLGDPRYARCYLREALKIAEAHVLIFWSSKILVLLSKVDLLCDSLNDCQVKLNGLKYMMEEKDVGGMLSKVYAEEDMQNVAKELDDHAIMTVVDVPMKGYELDDYVITTVVDVPMKGYVRKNFTSLIDWQSSPVNTKRNKQSTFKWSTDTLSSFPQIFSFCCMNLEIWFLGCLHFIAMDDLKTAKQHLTLLLSKVQLLEKTTALSVNTLASQLKDISVGSRRPVQKLKISLLLEIRLKLALLCSSDNKMVEAEHHLNVAMTELDEATIHGKYLHVNLYASLKYFQTVLSLKKVGKLSDLALGYSAFPSVKSILVPSVKLSNVAESLKMGTPIKSCNNPDIAVSKCSANQSVLKAPRKKDIIPHYLKEDIKEHSIGNKLSPLIFSSSDEENSPEVFSASNIPKRNQKTTDNSEKDFKFFKSKNSRPNIKSAGDIWKYTEIATPKSKKKGGSTSNRLFIYDDADVSKRTGQNRKTAKSDSCLKKTKSNVSTARNNKKEKSSVVDRELDIEELSIDPVRSSPISRKKLNSAIVTDDCSFPQSQKNFLNMPHSDLSSTLDSLCNDLDSIHVSNDSEEECVVLPGECLQEVIHILNDTRILLLHNRPYPLYTDICRLLAVLIHLSNENSDVKSRKASFMLSETLAMTLREVYCSNAIVHQKQMPAVATEYNTNSSEHIQTSCLLNSIPEDWRVVQVNTLLKNSSDLRFVEKDNRFKLIITQFQRSESPLMICTSDSNGVGFSMSLFSEFESIFHESKLITKIRDDKRKWWRTRQALDGRLQSVLNIMENLWVAGWKGFFLGKPKNEVRNNMIARSCEEMATLKKPLDMNLLKIVLDSAKYLTREQISAAVCHLWDCNLHDSLYTQLLKQIIELSYILPETKRHPVVLLLDKEIQALPWESMSVMKDSPVSRMPSLFLLNSILANQHSDSAYHGSIDCNKTYFVVNPGGDLKETEEFFEPIIKRQKCWNGIVGEAPTFEECLSAFKDYDMYLYVGHGSGRQYLSYKIDKLQLHAAALLMGCSSGRLKQLGKQVEAYGHSLQYILNGCPCVVGNLWDVTSKDIDRFTDKFLELFVPNYSPASVSKTDLASAVAEARCACIMRYLVAAAPVIYGLPIINSI